MRRMGRRGGRFAGWCNANIRNQQLKLLTRLLATAVLGGIMGWLVVAFVCYLPTLKFSTACGHNAYLMLAVTLPAGWALAWWLTGRSPA